MNELDVMGGDLGPIFWLSVFRVMWPLVMTRVGVLGTGLIPLLLLFGVGAI